MEAIKTTGIESILHSPAGSIQKIKNEIGEVTARAIVIYFLTDAVSFFNVSRTMNEDQIKGTVDLIFECYPSYTPEDFKLFFKNFKLRKYGNLFEGIDGGKILEALEKFEEWRIEEIRIFRKKEHESADEFDPSRIGQDFVEILKQLKEKFKVEPEEELVEVPDIPIVKRQRTEYEEAFQKYLREFDSIHFNIKDGYKQPIKMIQYKNNWFTQSDYCNKRFEEDYPQPKQKRRIQRNNKKYTRK